MTNWLVLEANKMSNKTPRKSNYTKSTGIPMMVTFLATLNSMAKVEDKVWMKLANLINHKSVVYPVKQAFKSLEKLSNLKSKLQKMANGEHDLNWMLSNSTLANLMMALYKEQVENKGYWSEKLVIYDNWNDNSAFRYIDDDHPLNHIVEEPEIDRSNCEFY